MQLGWAEQRRIGTNAPVVRQVEGDSVNHRVKIYRRTIFFHIHGMQHIIFSSLYGFK
jgi:Ser-tRNA(Ala) deacylase AlaX